MNCVISRKRSVCNENGILEKYLKMGPSIYIKCQNIEIRWRTYPLSLSTRNRIALYLKNEAFATKMVFLKNVLKWALLPIKSVIISKFADGTCLGRVPPTLPPNRMWLWPPLLDFIPVVLRIALYQWPNFYMHCKSQHCIHTHYIG